MPSPIHYNIKWYLQAVTDAMLEELKSCFMEAYDDNQDGKIDIREVCNAHALIILRG